MKTQRSPSRRRIFFASLSVLGALLALFAPAAAQDETDAPDDAAPHGPPVYVIPVDETVENALFMILNRAIRDAEAENARAIILDMDTFGGRVDAAIKIRDRLVVASVPTYTYVNPRAISAGAFIAVATKTIVMSPGSKIGAALPIMQLPGGGVEEVDRKVISAFASEMRSTAKHNGHPPEIVEAFVDPEVEIEGIKEKGDILTLDYDEATSVGLAAYIAPTLGDLLEREGFGSAPVQHFRMTAIDHVARFLASPVVSSILMLLGFGGIFIEIKTPGFGIPGLVGMTALAFFFFGSYLANLSGYFEIICFILGLVLLALELFVVPGFGVFGISGILLILGSLFFALFNLAPAGFDFRLARLETPILTMLATFIFSVPVFYLIAKVLPHTPIYASIRLAPPERKPTLEEQAAAAGGGAPPAPPEETVLTPGLEGVALTDLRPSGTARFGMRRVDVVAEGEFISHGEALTIYRIEGNRVVVRKNEE